MSTQFVDETREELHKLAGAMVQARLNADRKSHVELARKWIDNKAKLVSELRNA